MHLEPFYTQLPHPISQNAFQWFHPILVMLNRLFEILAYGLFVHADAVIGYLFIRIRYRQKLIVRYISVLYSSIKIRYES